LAFLVAIEGIDGSGKGTQAQRLQATLIDSGETAALISFPRYTSTLFGNAVGDFLNGRFGALDDVSPFLVSLLYAGDRFESRQLLCEALRRHDVVVLDRYVASNVAHQGAKLTGEQRREFVDWIRTIEYEIFELPRPDLVVLLDLPARKAQQLIARKRTRTYTEKAADLQESDLKYLEKVRGLYLELAAAEPGWYRLECLPGESLRSIDEIADEVRTVLADRRNT